MLAKPTCGRNRPVHGRCKNAGLGPGVIPLAGVAGLCGHRTAGVGGQAGRVEVIVEQVDDLVAVAILHPHTMRWPPHSNRLRHPRTFQASCRLFADRAMTEIKCL